MRGYSWVITATTAKAATKADLVALRTICLSPPAPPFAIVLSDSGQTHQLYRGRVNHAADPITITLESEPIAYRHEQLVAALELAGRVCAVGGKRALSEPMSPNRAIAIIERYRGGERVADDWSHTWSTGLGRLAAWLTPKKEVCQHEFPQDQGDAAD